MKKISFVKTLTLIAILGHIPAVFAQNSGTYIGLSLNHTSTHIADITVENQSINNIITGTTSQFTSSTDSAGTNTWMIFGGYQFTKFLAIEMLYAPLGEYTRSASGISHFGPTKRALAYKTLDSLKLDGYGITGLANIPITDHLSIIGKYGAFHWSGQLNHSTSFTTVGLPMDDVYSTDKDSGISPIIGLGARYKLKHAVSAIVEWIQINNVGGSLSTGDSNVTLYSIGAQINF